jgi:class 3 adenylate cyclase
LLAEHNEAVRAEIERFGGREAKTTGDGFLVLFDSPARAVRGIAVHAAARILGAAQPGEVLVSTTVRDLLTGSGLMFADRGEFELRGLDGRRRLAALVR